MKFSFGTCFLPVLKSLTTRSRSGVFRAALAACGLATGLLAGNAPPKAVRMLAISPLRFEPAADDSPTRFIARGARFRFEFERDRVEFYNSACEQNLRFVGVPAGAPMRGEDRLASLTNLFLGNDPSQWRTAVPNYSRLRVDGLYPGIDVVYYGSAGQLEYDLTVKPGADPRQIRFMVEGGRAHVDRRGNLIAGLIQKSPVAYQVDADGKRTPVESRYRKNRDGSYGFEIGRFDRSRELVIDPVLTLAQYVAGSFGDIAYAIGHDSQGMIYVAGETYSKDLPQPLLPSQPANGGGRDVFFAVINPSNAQVVYTTYLGGSGDETFGGMQVGPQGDVYLTGATASSNFPTVNPAHNALAATNATNVFIAWFNSSRGLAYSTYLGGSAQDIGHAIAVDAKGRMWVTGVATSDNFPNVNAIQGYSGQGDIFIAGVDPSLSGAATVTYSTYLGGTAWDVGRGIAIAADGTLWVVGGTGSVDIRIVGFCYQYLYQGGGDAYLAHLDPALGPNSLLYATYLGGSNLEEARNVVIDATGRVIVSGYTNSAADFPITSDALQTQFGGNIDVFVSILDSSIMTSRSAQLIYSTYFGGSDADVAFDMKEDASGSLYLSGFTLSAGLPAGPQSLQADYDGSMDAFALKFSPARSGAAALDYFTYLGSDGLQIAYGIDFDAHGNIFLTGFTSGPIFDAFGGPAKTTNPGNVDGFVAGFRPIAPPATN